MRPLRTAANCVKKFGRANDADRDVWLADAGTKNGFDEPLLVGDSNLDGSVDTLDLNALALSWRQADQSAWTRGNFTADGSPGVNSADLNQLALNWKQSISVVEAASVPETSSLFVAILGIALVWRRCTCIGRSRCP